MEEYSSYKYLKKLSADTLSFAYLGKISDDMITSSVNLLEENISQDSSLKKSHRKLSFLIVESFQNVLRYGNLDKKLDFEYKKEMFFVNHTSCYVNICSVNLIQNTKIEYVRERICTINSLDNKALTQLYKDVLTNEEFTQAGGAGLGFIEMVRKTKHKISFDFVKINEEYSYIYMLVLFTSKSATPEQLECKNIDLEWFKEFHSYVNDDGISIIYKGNMYPQIVEPVLSLVTENTHSDNLDIQQVTFDLMLETLQNIQLNLEENLDDNQITISVKHENDKYDLSISKFIANTISEKIENEFKEVNCSSPDELQQRYEELASPKHATNIETMLKLVITEFAIETKNKFKYQFSPADENKTIQSIKVEF